MEYIVALEKDNNKIASQLKNITAMQRAVNEQYEEEKMKEVHLKSFADGFYGCLNAVIRQFNEGRTKNEILNWCKSVRDNRQIIIPEETEKQD